MKLKCRKCIREHLSDTPCYLWIHKSIKYDRDDWEKALRRCPFENSTGDKDTYKLTGVVPLAEWDKV